MADKYTFTGSGQTGYPSYTDLATERMLIAEPGESYGIRAVEPDLFPVPPGDGRWTTVPPSPPPVAAKPLVTAPASTEGGAA